MNIKAHIARNGLRGRAVTKALALDKTNHAAAVKYCKQYADSRKTLPQRINSSVEHDQYVDQVVAKKGAVLDGVLAAKDIYLLAHPLRLLEYLHCSKKRRNQIGVNAQFWTNARISPESGTCKSHFVLANSGKAASKGQRPRLLEFAKFGGSYTKTGHVKCFTIASVIAQFKAEGLPFPF